MLIFSTSIVWSFIKREITIAYEKYSQFVLAYMQSKEGQLFWNEALSDYLCHHQQSLVDICFQLCTGICLFVKGEGCHLNKAVYKMFVMMITFPNLSINDDSNAVSSQYKSDANIRSCTV
jgi:hypothetical protein